jgi:hypothetical protein
MRTVLAAAAAGALIMGSAAGAIADDATTTTPTVAPAPVVKIQTVDIHRHSPINVDKARSLKVRMTVRTSPSETPLVTSASVTLHQYTKKVGGKLTEPTSIVEIPVTLMPTATTVGKDGTVISLKGEVAKEVLAGLGTATAPALPAIAEGKSALLCITTATTAPTQESAWSKQTMKRLAAKDVKKPVRECVKVFNPKAKPAKPTKSS